MDVGVFGAGGFGREVAWIVDAMGEAGDVCRVRCFLDDAAVEGQMLHDHPVLVPAEAKRRYPGLQVVCAIGTSQTRMKVVEAVERLGLPFFTAIHPDAQRSRRVVVGQGSMICAGTVITTDIEIGRHVTVNIGTTIGHDCVIEDFVTITPGVNLTGRVHVKRGAYIGIGANLVCRSTMVPLVIGEDAIVGAGSVVLDDVADGQMVVGIPAKPKASRRNG